jgi:S-DNA-T family DNA segregation ATPase FtsK/SpoIIIE
MRLKLTLATGDRRDDIVVTVDATATVSQLAERLRVSNPHALSPTQPGSNLTLRVHPTAAAERVVAPDATLGDAGIRSGDLISLTNAAAGASGSQTTAATLRVLAGPDAGKVFNLPGGTTIIGRDRNCDVRLSDPLVSKRHAKLNISSTAEVIDDGSANGVEVNGEPTLRAVIRASDDVRIGDTRLSVSVIAGQAADDSGHAVAFNRSPRLDPKYEGVEVISPELPQRPQAQRFPIIPFVAPIVMAGLMYTITRNASAILFVALSPLMLIGNFFENRIAGSRAYKQGIAAYRASLTDLAVQLQYACDAEREMRRYEHPAVTEVADHAVRLAPLTWTRRPEHDSFLEVRLGLGAQPSRNKVKLPAANNTTAEMWRELMAVVDSFSTVDRVPVVGRFRESGGIGVAGPTTRADELAYALVTQVAGLHSPAEVVLAAAMGPDSSTRWEFLKWLPHTASEFTPLAVEHLAVSSVANGQLIAALEDLIDARSEVRRSKDDPPPIPSVVVVVDDAAPFDRSRMVQVAERGQALGVHVIWCAPSVERLPAACRTYLVVDPNTAVGSAGFVADGSEVTPLELEPLDRGTATRVARAMAPVIDGGAVLEDQSDLPRSVSFVTLAGTEVAESIDDIVARWQGSNSLPSAPGAGRLKRDNHLRAIVGQGASDRFYLDLRAQGPHALVGGTTGAGKSEFLQSWVLGMAAAHSPTRVNFLFVDYKGGAAFADCIHLPHNVGLVTDLSPHLVKRALTSLTAELRRREHILNGKKAKDLLELERRNDPECPPSLVIVVDEFAALVSEVPEFVDGVVNIAQRGRSLGLHLILATQRPAGVIKDNLRANTNLRVALRMADESDSTDVVGSPLAATFDPSLPGRGVAKTGPGRLTSFQSAYAGGWTTNEPPKPSIDIVELPFGLGPSWEEPESAAPVVPAVTGANDIKRVVATIGEAATRLALPPVRQPWLPDLAPTYRLEELPTSRTDAQLVFGVADVPEDQDQPVVSFNPDTDGNMAVFGTGGSGKSAFLRSLAVAGAFAPARGGPVHVYAFDFGARGLQMLEPFPHVAAVVNGDDHERIVRVIKLLRATIDERAARYARVQADSVVQYRERAGQPNEPRLLLLVDNFGAFRQGYELGERSRWFEAFQGILNDGRPVGVHVVLSADRPAALPSSLGSSVQRKLALRLANEMDYSMLNSPADAFTSTTPPGRGFLDGTEVQVAIIGGDPNIARQAADIQDLAASMRRADIVTAPPVQRLPERVVASELPATVNGLPLLGVWDETLEPLGFETSGVFLVSGPPQSGRTTTVASLVSSLRRARPSTTFVYVGRRRSPLVGLPWDASAFTPDDIDTLASEWAALIAADDPSAADVVVVIESVGDLLNSAADLSLQELLKACRAQDRFVIAEDETSTLGGSWPLLQGVKASRYGIALQPEQVDGDSLYKTSFGRLNKAEFPPGRGLFVTGGKTYRVQVALPE